MIDCLAAAAGKSQWVEYWNDLRRAEMLVYSAIIAL
jgi:hypothetical protein